jgi:lactate dehydrogenase-like 2-hydroxyacid dehydrogenase
LINTSRGLVVNEKDIIKSIKNGKLKGYATDVLINEQTSDMKWLNDNPIWKEYTNEGKILITPHIGGATKDSLIKVDNFVLTALSRSKAK